MRRKLEWKWLANRSLVFIFATVIFGILLRDLFYGLAMMSAFTMILITNKIYNEGYFIEYDLIFEDDNK